MPDQELEELVELALDECVKSFKRGVDSHGPPTFDTTEVVQQFRDRFKYGFRKALKSNGKQWHGGGGDAARVTRTAFYLGAITAFHAHAEGTAKVTPRQFEDKALPYVQTHCEERWIRLVYCAWGPDAQS